MNVLPEPVAIWMSARGRFSQAIAQVLDRPDLGIPQRLDVQRRHRSDARADGWGLLVGGDPRQPFRESLGRWMYPPNMRRLRGSGSEKQVKRDSVPVASYPKGSGVTGAGMASGTPLMYLRVCRSTSVSVVPSGFASRTPTSWRST